MASLQEIKSRIDSIKTIRKITRAMQLVATSKLQKVKKNLEPMVEYYESVYSTFGDLINNADDINDLFPEKPADKTLFIIISSDLGLCAGFNSNMFKLLKAQIRTQDEIITIGGKALLHAKQTNKKLINSYVNTGEKIPHEIVSEITSKVISEFMTGGYKKINIIFTKYINSVTFEASTKQIFPILKSDTGKAKTNMLVEFDPSPGKVLVSSLPLYVSAMLYGTYTESKVSEMASRRTAMENATDNADELNETLSIKYNRERQSSITQEISEIVAGSE